MSNWNVVQWIFDDPPSQSTICSVMKSQTNGFPIRQEMTIIRICRRKWTQMSTWTVKDYIDRKVCWWWWCWWRDLWLCLWSEQWQSHKWHRPLHWYQWTLGVGIEWLCVPPQKWPILPFSFRNLSDMTFKTNILPTTQTLMLISMSTNENSPIKVALRIRLSKVAWCCLKMTSRSPTKRALWPNVTRDIGKQLSWTYR